MVYGSMPASAALPDSNWWLRNDFLRQENLHLGQHPQLHLEQEGASTDVGCSVAVERKLRCALELPRR